jgi:hypothetical protein
MTESGMRDYKMTEIQGRGQWAKDTPTPDHKQGARRKR